MSRMSILPRADAPASGHVLLWSIFDRFSGHHHPAYRHPRGELTFASLHAAVLRLLPVMVTLPRQNERRPILIWGHKGCRYPVAYWACLLTGHALVPVEPETPLARIRQIMEACDPCAMLLADGRPGLIERFADLEVPEHLAVCQVPDMDVQGVIEPASSFVRELDISDGDTAYIMFSSGTLGTPKGIQVTYANLVDFIAWLDILFADPSHVKGVSGTIRHCFDVSLFELWMSWARLLPLTTLDHADIADPTGYISRLVAGRVSLWVSTPSIVRLFLKNRRFNGQNMPDLSTFLFCGEPLTKSIVASLFDRFPDCRVINTYGPTECTVAVTSVEITSAELEAPEELPIGAARRGTRLELAPGTPPGEAGEIWIRGASVGRGYIGLPQKQAYAFPQPDLYRTGDRGLCGPDGQWYFHGRLDREIKIQGVRIDVNDVEAHIRRQPGVEDVAVEPYVLHGEARALSAFILGAEDNACLERLAAALSSDLPPYLVPRYWYGGFPSGLNMNSKLDRAHLTMAAGAAKLRHVHMHAADQPPGYNLQEQSQ